LALKILPIFSLAEAQSLVCANRNYPFALKLAAFIAIIHILGCSSDHRPHTLSRAERVLPFHRAWQHSAELTEIPFAPIASKKIQQCQRDIGLPIEVFQFADPSNYGARKQFASDGRQLPFEPTLIVLHETVMDESSTISLFKTPHPSDDQQVSYHLLVARDGSLIRIVPDGKRAFGAGKSHFGGYTIRSSPGSPGSINNIALHVSLVSPQGEANSSSHSGYTDDQYRSLAGQVLKWQMAYGIPISSVTTHQVVDRSHSRYDPRSFNWDVFDRYHLQAAEACGVRGLAYDDRK
jgi:hypothetical protein